MLHGCLFPSNNIKLHLVFWRNRQTTSDTLIPIYSSEMGVRFLFGHFLSTLHSQFCSYRPSTTLLGAGCRAVCQEIRHHTTKSISYTLTSDVHFTSIKYVTMCILFGITWSGPFRYYNSPFLLCRQDSACLFPSEISEKGTGKTFPLQSL